MSSIKSKKLQSKIRMYSNCELGVNSIRAEMHSALGIKKSIKLNEPVLKEQPIDTKQLSFLEGEKKSLGASPSQIKKSWKDIKANVFIEYSPSMMDKVKKLIGELNRKGNIVIANMSFKELDDLIKEDAETNAIFNIQLGQSIVVPRPKVRLSREVPTSSLNGVNEGNNGGKGVLIGIIDVGGFDFSHPDFLDNNEKTRFISIWDQGSETRPSPKGYNYGAELTSEMLNSAIKAMDEYNVPAYQLEPQSQMSEGSHGTHVSSIAAGNSGVCPNAEIAAVLLALPNKDYDRRRSFYDSTRIADAVDYLLQISEERGLPISINISLGTNGHAHDGSAAISRWIDSELKIPGRSVCVAAGNAGQEKSEFEGDYGYIMGRIHTSGTITSSGLDRDIEWVVVGNRVVDISENELEVWYGSQDRFAISVKPPGMDWIGPIEPGEYLENEQLDDLSFISVYNELYHPSNGSNYISVFLTPYLSDSSIKGIPSGLWRIRIHGRVIRDGGYHAWIERDDPRRLFPINDAESAWSFPSFFTETSNVDNTSVSSLACGHEIISVANLDEETNRINISSSQGPTRDSRFKPDVSAPGTNILAAGGFSYNNPWVKMTGTSMSSPYVCGVVGLMLEAERTLTSAQIIGILKSTSQPLPGSDYKWKNDSGFGSIQIKKCIEEAKLINQNKDITS